MLVQLCTHLLNRPDAFALCECERVSTLSKVHSAHRSHCYVFTYRYQFIAAHHSWVPNSGVGVAWLIYISAHCTTESIYYDYKYITRFSNYVMATMEGAQYDKVTKLSVDSVSRS